MSRGFAMTTQTIRISRRGPVRAAPRIKARGARPDDGARRAGSPRVRPSAARRRDAQPMRAAARRCRVRGVSLVVFGRIASGHGDRAGCASFTCSTSRTSAAITRSSRRDAKRARAAAATAPRRAPRTTHPDATALARTRRANRTAAAARRAVAV
ncbi:hypothetical protein [Burkholderia sp. MSMB617WGS]|uniref:hypothetical protein n=1 Tax=Burkholderia sp. MSMB617WGS TaxID=1637831 RepID=UPI0011AE23FB|nr:hypothetical protein [Burkholderia sp. MSMB617WGS]